MENLKKRHQRLEKEKIINNFFKLMAIYKKMINSIMVIILLINIILELINNFELYRIVVLIALLIIFAFISTREIRWFNKAKC